MTVLRTANKKLARIVKPEKKKENFLVTMEKGSKVDKIGVNSLVQIAISLNPLSHKPRIQIQVKWR